MIHKNNWHVGDYNLFWENIRTNVTERILSFDESCKATINTVKTSMRKPIPELMTRILFRLSFTIILVSITSIVLGQESLSNFSENFKYSKESLDGPTINPENTTWLHLASDDLAKIRMIDAPLVTWSVLLPGEGQVELTLLESCPFPEYIPVGERIDDGSGGVKVNERDFKTDLKTFDITGPGIGGSMVDF